jgi:preprotein translocase subunit SecD
MLAGIHIMKKLIPLITACLIASAAVVVASSTPPVFQIRLALDTPSSDSEPMALVTEYNGNTSTNVLNIQKKVLLDESALKSVKPGQDQIGRPLINIVLNDAGTKQFAEVSRQNLHKRLAIIINGQLCSAPTLQSEISSGKMQITGSFSKQEVEDLVGKINGALSRQ